MVARVKVAVIEDHQSMRNALERLLRASSFETACFASADDFLRAADCSAFDCAVVDVHLPGKSGLQLQTEMRRKAPFTSLIFITGHADLALGVRAMREGAIDFLEKPVNDQTLIEAIHRGAVRSRQRRAAFDEESELRRRCDLLTPREHEVFALITKGLLNKQAGAQLGTTERTIKAHRARVMEKMGAESLADLVRMAGALEIHAGRRD